jgi:tetratricopeptide (TPR) repeat protein
MRAAVVVGLACVVGSAGCFNNSETAPRGGPAADPVSPANSLIEQGRAAHKQAETLAARYGRQAEAVQVHYRQALDYYAAAIEAAPQSARAYALRGRTLLRIGRPAEAETNLARALEIDPQLAEALATRGRVRFEKGRIPQAVADFDQALQLDPSNIFALNNRGIARLAQGEIDAAEEDFRAAISWDGAYYKAHYNLGNVHRRRGELEQAIESYTRTIDINPEFVSAWRNRGNAHRDLKQFDAAIADYDRAIDLDPADDDHFVLRAAVRMMRDLHEPQQHGVMLIDETQRASAEASLADLKTALAKAPGENGVRFQYGLLLRACGRYEEAMAEFNALLAADENKTDVLAQRGLTHQMAGRRGEAFADLSAAIAREPENPVFYQLRASLLLEQGDQEAAAADVARAHQLEARSARFPGGVF